MTRLLVIDACPGFREIARSILESAGHETIEARDGLAGLQAAIEDAPDAILVDAGLAGLDGIDICERLAGAPETRGIPILVWAADDSELMRRRALRAGASGFLARSSSPGLLRREVDGLLARAWVVWAATSASGRVRAAFCVAGSR